MRDNVNSLSGACTGCGACSIVCTRQAIQVKLNSEGFYSAEIDGDLCTECGRCISVCIRQDTSANTVPLLSGTLLASQSAQIDMIKSCTSGGIAYELTKRALSQGMTVAGVKYDYSTDTAKTVVAHTLEDAEVFKGSKYLQSYCVDAFQKLVDDASIDTDTKYLVFGTPCQIFGLASVLEVKKIRDRFILVDLFCHGVPSAIVWQMYIKEIKQKVGQIKSVHFREKSIGWHNFVMKIEGQKGVYRAASEGDQFYHVFFDNVLFAESCFNCKVRQSESKADIRLGDFWGPRYQDREDGVSAVLLLTDRGKDFFRETEHIATLGQVEVSEMIAAQSIHSYPTIRYRKDAYRYLLEESDLKKVIRKYRKLFDFRTKTKLIMKELTVYLPDGIRSKIRNVYRKQR